jgi:hypothetical protein
MSAQPNVELAYRVLDHIDANPEQWNQATWFGRSECGTTGCFAGWAVALAGHDIDFDPEPNEWDGRQPYASIDGDGNKAIRDVAAAELRISGEDEEVLFDGDNTREDLGDLVAEIFGPRPDGGR